MISVIILNYNTWEDTLKEAAQVHDILSIEYKDIIIVDNMSTNDSYQQLHNSNKGFVLIKSNENGGYAKGNNIGLKYSYDHGYNYSFILNNDIVFSDRNLLSKLVCILQKDDSLAAVNPDVLDINGRVYNRNSKRPNFFDLTIGIPLYAKRGRQLDLINDYGYIYRPQGCCMLVDLSKMSEVDYFDEYTFLYNEELILAERLLQKGYKCACCTNTKVIHNHSKTINSLIKKNKILKFHQVGYKYYLMNYRKYNMLCTNIGLLFNYLKFSLLT